MLKFMANRRRARQLISAGYKEKLTDWLRLEISDRRRRKKELEFFDKLHKDKEGVKE